MESGSIKVTQRATAYLASFAFGVTFLLATLHGCDGSTALSRGAVACVAAVVLGRLLAKPIVDVVFDAMARDEAKRRAKQEEEA